MTFPMKTLKFKRKECVEGEHFQVTLIIHLSRNLNYGNTTGNEKWKLLVIGNLKQPCSKNVKILPL